MWKIIQSVWVTVKQRLELAISTAGLAAPQKIYRRGREKKRIRKSFDWNVSVIGAILLLLAR